jgi:hypothetical protein
MTVNGIFDRLYGCRDLFEERIGIQMKALRKTTTFLMAYLATGIITCDLIDRQ